MKKFNTGLIIAAVLIILAELVLIASNNFNWSKILSPILTIIAMILVIFVVVRSLENDKEQNKH